MNKRFTIAAITTVITIGALTGCSAISETVDKALTPSLTAEQVQEFLEAQKAAINISDPAVRKVENIQQQTDGLNNIDTTIIIETVSAEPITVETLKNILKAYDDNASDMPASLTLEFVYDGQSVDAQDAALALVSDPELVSVSTKGVTFSKDSYSEVFETE